MINIPSYPFIMTVIRPAQEGDLPSILEIYNQGIQDRVATLEEDAKDMEYMKQWFESHANLYAVLVAEILPGEIGGWASLNPYSHRCAYSGVADLSVYIRRELRGRGLGSLLLSNLEQVAKTNGFHKIVLMTFPFNLSGQGLYRKIDYRSVGIFDNQGKLDGRFIDVMAMEKLL